MPFNPSPGDEIFLGPLRDQRIRTLQKYFDEQVQSGLLKIFLGINHDITAAAVDVSTKDTALKNLINHAGLWNEIDPLLDINRIELFRNAVDKMAQQLRGSSWDNYMKGLDNK